MNDKNLEVLEQALQYGQEMLYILRAGQTEAGEFSVSAREMMHVIKTLERSVPMKIYNEYREFFTSFCDFCMQCGNTDFLVENVDMMDSSLELFTECMTEMKNEYANRVKKCICCGNQVIYTSLPSYYEEMKHKFGVTYEAKGETINKDEYMCPVCGASDRDRMILSFLEKANLKKASDGFRVLQFAPAQSIENWIKQRCPQVTYESTDLFMEHVSFQSDIQDMNMVEDETYDLLICSHVLEHVQDDKKALREMKRILKPDGKLIFLVPIDLNTTEIDEEWGLTEEENWKRFGQGDHCRRYGKEGLMERIGQEFYMHCLGKEFFGEGEFFQDGLIDTSTLYVLTKGEEVSLDMEEVVCIDEKLCKEGPLVSVILPSYNHEQFVEEAIKSILNQSYKNIEILVADDGSTDNTPAIMQKYSSHFAKEFYFKENAGGGRPQFLNQFVKGKYIALMHSDDIWDKDKLAIQVEYMENHEECGCCLTWCDYIDENMQTMDFDVFIKGNRSSYEWMRYFWEKGNALCNPSSLIRSEIGIEVQKYGWACRQLPDFFKWIGLIQQHSIYIVPKALTKMRRYQKNGSANTSAESKVNIVRHNIEEGNNWLWVIRDMEPEFFKNTFKDIMVHPQADTEIEMQCEKYFLLLNHYNRFVQNSAFCYFFEIYNDVRECMAEKYHYTRKDFAVDMVERGLAPAFLN